MGIWETMLNSFISNKTVLFVLIIDFISTWICEKDSTVENDTIIDLVLSKSMPSQWNLLRGQRASYRNKILKEKVEQWVGDGNDWMHK